MHDDLATPLAALSSRQAGQSDRPRSDQPPPDDPAAALENALEEKIEGEVRFDTISRALYSTDASVYQMMPLGVVIPRSRDDVIRVVNDCRRHGFSITARGGGTSQAGQAVGTGVQLDFSKYMNLLLELDPDAQTVRVQPGIVLDELNALLKPYGLQLPLDLSTSNRATIGGMIANNSSGTRSVVYGKTLDYVSELTVVLSDGSVATLRPLDKKELARQCKGNNLAGACYREVRALAAKHAAEIERRYPKILRRVGGYNLDQFTDTDNPFNLARLLVGSEGTLALVLEAKLRVVPLPKHRAVCVVHFSDLLGSLAATPAILAHRPSAVELMDRFILNTTQGKTEFEPLRDFVSGDPAAVLIVEFFGDSPQEATAHVDRLEDELRRRGLGYHFHRAASPAAQGRIWSLRRAALGLSMSRRGDAKAISFVEDTAVAPDRLRDYIERFIEILDEHQTEAGFYAHASVGLLHVRPVVDMKLADGIEKFQRIAERIADLVLEFGGALSGEHGDGLVRAPFQERMYGPVLYKAFRQLKKTFDPRGTFNPGKIVHAPPITDNLRFGAQYQTRPLKTTFDFSDFGGISRAAEQCGGVGACRKTLDGTMCPSYMATREEADSTRGRANSLRLAISGQLGPEGLTDPRLYPILDLCLECKACKSECPTGVDMARLKSEFLHQFYGRHGTPRRVKLLANVERLAIWGSRLAPLSNWIVQGRAARWLNEKLFGLDRRRVPPRYARRTFLDWHAKNSGPNRHSPENSQVALFVDTFTNFHEPIHAIAAWRMAERLGARPIVANRVCCGRPLISKGLLTAARRQAEAVTQSLASLAWRGIPILFCEPSCYSAVRDDHPHLLQGKLRADAKTVAAACVTFEEWAATALASRLQQHGGSSLPPLCGGPKRVLLHAHCHQKALVGTGPAVRLLSMIPGCEVTDLDAGCCGMAGSFGYEQEHYDLSRAVAERKLLPAIADKDPDTVVVATGFSCRHQIDNFTSSGAMSAATLIEPLLIDT